MSCTTIIVGGKVVGFACARASGKKCVQCGARAGAVCDFPLKGAKAGQTCSRPLCGKCLVKMDASIDYCPPHAAMTTRQRPKPDITVTRPRRTWEGSKPLAKTLLAAPPPVRTLEEAVEEFDQTPLVRR
jgi:hypothetical protein